MLRFDKNVFMECHEVSAMPINLKTPSRTSLTGSGGALKDRTSLKDSGLMSPTAVRAS